jgi:hypothetical protein
MALEGKSAIAHDEERRNRHDEKGGAKDEKDSFLLRRGSPVGRLHLKSNRQPIPLLEYRGVRLRQAAGWV